MQSPRIRDKMVSLKTQAALSGYTGRKGKKMKDLLLVDLIKDCAFTASGFCRIMRETVKPHTRGCRNIASEAAKLALAIRKTLSPVQIPAECKGYTVVRVTGKQFGCAAHSDYRQVLDICYIDHKAKKWYIGSYGERIDPETIVYGIR